MAGISIEARERIRPQFDRIVAGVASGRTVKAVLLEAGIDSSMWYEYLRAIPGARQDWDDAREQSGHAFMDEVLDEARADVDKELAQHVRTRIDALKWAARVRNPRAYADKATVDVNVRSVDLTKIISEANARLEAQRQGRIINAETESNSSGSQPERMHAIPAAIEHALDLAPELASLL